jgi:hypothetical protein
MPIIYKKSVPAKRKIKYTKVSTRQLKYIGYISVKPDGPNTELLGVSYSTAVGYFPLEQNKYCTPITYTSTQAEIDAYVLCSEQEHM